MVGNQVLETILAPTSLAYFLTSPILSVPYAVTIDLAIFLVLLLKMDIVFIEFRINRPFSRFSILF